MSTLVGKRLRRITGALVALSAFAPMRVDAHDPEAWRVERTARFAAVQAAGRPHDENVAEIKAATAKLVARQAPLSQAALDRPPVVWRTSAKPAVVFDTPVGPRMIVMPAGEYTMGSTGNERGRDQSEGPRQRVRFKRAFAVSLVPVTYGEYSWFVYETHRASGKSCVTVEQGELDDRAGRNWDNPGFEQGARSPATCIGFADAVAYTNWLSRKTGEHYRLLTEAEYEYANRAGTSGEYWFGHDSSAACGFVNGLDQSASKVWANTAANGCTDGWPFTTPLDKSKLNPFGLIDTTGNVASWTADCWHNRLSSASNGSTQATRRQCREAAVRGGSWMSPPQSLRSASRQGRLKSYIGADLGFRVARDL